MTTLPRLAEDFVAVRKYILDVAPFPAPTRTVAFAALARLEARIAEMERERDELENHRADTEDVLARKIFALVAAEARVVELREEFDRQLARHLCYTSESSRSIFWREVDAVLAATDESKQAAEPSEATPATQGKDG